MGNKESKKKAKPLDWGDKVTIAIGGEDAMKAVGEVVQPSRVNEAWFGENMGGERGIYVQVRWISGPKNFPEIVRREHLKRIDESN